MDEKTISQKVLDEIRKKNITPEPRWKFQAGRLMVLAFVLVLLAISGLAVGVIFELLSQFHFDSMVFRPRGLRLISESFPYLWLILVVGALILAVAEFLRTRHGYKYRLSEIVAVFGSLSIFLGSIFFIFGQSGQTERFLEKSLPQYGKMTRTPREFWVQPEKGLVSGIILKNDEGIKIMALRDWGGHDWDVDYSKAKVAERVVLKEGVFIKVIGEKKTDVNFFAEEIRPWMRPGGMMMRRHMDTDVDFPMPMMGR